MNLFNFDYVNHDQDDDEIVQWYNDIFMKDFKDDSIANYMAKGIRIFPQPMMLVIDPDRYKILESPEECGYFPTRLAMSLQFKLMEDNDLYRFIHICPDTRFAQEILQTISSILIDSANITDDLFMDAVEDLPEIMSIAKTKNEQYTETYREIFNIADDCEFMIMRQFCENDAHVRECLKNIYDWMHDLSMLHIQMVHEGISHNEIPDELVPQEMRTMLWGSKDGACAYKYRNTAFRDNEQVYYLCGMKIDDSLDDKNGKDERP